MKLRFSAWVLAMAVALAPGAAIGQSPDEQLEQLRAENRALRAENEALRAELQRLRARLGEPADRRAPDAATEAPGAEAAEPRRIAELEAELADARQKLQARSQRAAEQFVVVRDDPATGRAVITSRPTRLQLTRGSADEHWVHFEIDRRGDKVSRSQLIIRAFYTGTDYRGEDRITFHIDGRPVACEIAAYDRRARITGVKRRRDRSDETLTVNVPVEVLRQIGDATEVTGDIAFVDFKLTGDQLRIAGALADAATAGDASGQ